MLCILVTWSFLSVQSLHFRELLTMTNRTSLRAQCCMWCCFEGIPAMRCRLCYQPCISFVASTSGRGGVVDEGVHVGRACALTLTVSTPQLLSMHLKKRIDVRAHALHTTARWDCG
ncbi:hypothetical protein BC826DRAFT_543511 [Russula brevipes]|nr:hypothetical protein BC826DRAFT_543511 [Russula brevipes]